MAVSTILFEDIFDVKDIDQDGKKFERGEVGWADGPLSTVCAMYLFLQHGCIAY